MAPITLTLTADLRPYGRVAADVIAPDRMATMSGAELAALPVWIARGTTGTDAGATIAARRTLPLGALFTIEGERSDVVRLRGDLRAVDALGAGMRGGTLIVEGSVGDEVGRGMAGGSIAVEGSAGHDAGRTMLGGQLTVAGDVGDRLGGPLPGASRGMMGGEIFVRGRAGREVALGVRRGLIVVGGDVEDGCGQGMLAGTVVVVGRAGGTVGEWSKRGSVIAIGGARIPPTYRFACTYRPAYLRLLYRHLRTRGIAVPEHAIAGRYLRYCGDMSELGRGEILTLDGPGDA